jgi:hypothetical protein
MIVRLPRKHTLAGTGFQQALCQGDAGRDVILLHFLNGQVAVFMDVFFVLLVASLCLYGQKAYSTQE